MRVCNLLSLVCTQFPFGCISLWLAQPFFKRVLPYIFHLWFMFTFQRRGTSEHARQMENMNHGLHALLHLDTVVRRSQTATQRYNKTQTSQEDLLWVSMPGLRSSSDSSVWMAWGSADEMTDGRPLGCTVHSQLIWTNNCRHSISQNLQMHESLGPVLSFAVWSLFKHKEVVFFLGGRPRVLLNMP